MKSITSVFFGLCCMNTIAALAIDVMVGNYPDTRGSMVDFYATLNILGFGYNFYYFLDSHLD